MVTISAEYQGDLRTQATHDPSGTQLITDAPLDNHGKGQSFSPTDLLGTSLLTCVSTLIGIQANASKINLKGMKLNLKKIMSTEPPRRVAQFLIDITMPIKIEDQDKARLERAASRCPVIESLHPSIEKKITFHWKDED